ncbi:MAG: putative peptidoglycan glycosyltransferase FtsW [Hyphomicrobiaceae bacterium]|nr:putative peptidoglycan glycosyltransferase FtsW [Hyphomicrobiaceae bacterium]
MTFSRADRSRLVTWWFTVDRVLLGAILVLVFVGLVLSLAASPAVAVKKGLDPFYFFERHLLFSAAGVAIMLGLSLLSPSHIRRVAAILFLGSLAALVWVEVSGPVVNGSQRWLYLGGLSIQPSEIAKPAVIMLLAWFFAEAVRRPDMPALPIAVVIGGVLVGLLLAQPDVGQAVLVAATWGTLYLLAGLPLVGALVFVVLFTASGVAAYAMFGHVRLRVDAYLAADTERNSQADRALQSFMEGGFLGRGPGEGTIKTHFPDAHTDYIFAVVAEEYGSLACLLLAALFGLIVVKAMIVALDEPRAANRLAIQGLAIVFGMQALINMGVNVGLLPAKGMTLPFLSAGGSSLLAISVTLGFLLAMTRRRADPARHVIMPSASPSPGLSQHISPGRT